MLIAKLKIYRTKLKIYKSPIRPVVTYALEVLCMTKERRLLRVFKRDILRNMPGQKRINDGETRPMINFEFLKEIEEEDIVRMIKASMDHKRDDRVEAWRE